MSLARSVLSISDVKWPTKLTIKQSKPKIMIFQHHVLKPK